MLNALFKISVFVIRGISVYLTNSTFWAKEGCIQQCWMSLGGRNQKLNFFFFDKAPGRDNVRMEKCFQDGLLKMINVSTYNMNPVNKYT